ncbi:MAG: aminotransferase class V-fold PLP-dependent enzyme [Alphaproteobacteria bacterium]|nr:aminotransferase class V-fold PLP-dependent enzyme [Alphaproteobacteria bacterium]
MDITEQIDSADRLSVADARRLFPNAVDAPHLNVAARGTLAEPTVAAMDALVRGHQDGTALKEDWAVLGERLRGRFARLIGARPAEVAFTKNTAEGINIVAASFPWQPGDNVVVCPEVEHPNNIYAWLNLKRRGVEVRTVEARNHAIDADAVVRAMDGRTRVVTAALVSFTPGFRAPVATLAEACRKRGAMLAVDAVQCCGVLKVDVDAMGIDALATATSKGLLGLYGHGFLFVRQSWIDRLEPVYLARFSVDQGAAHESEMGSLDYKLLPDARRFEVGHYDWPGVAAADASLDILLRVGAETIERHALRLADRLRDGLEQSGFTVSRAPENSLRTHIVTAGRMDGGAYETTDPRLNAVARRLGDAGVRFSIRRGLLRLATHVYNDDGDIDQVLALARGN